MCIKLYIYDMIIDSRTKYDLDLIKGGLSREFSMKEEGEEKLYLGIEISRNRTNNTLRLCKEIYAMRAFE